MLDAQTVDKIYKADFDSLVKYMGDIIFVQVQFSCSLFQGQGLRIVLRTIGQHILDAVMVRRTAGQVHQRQKLSQKSQQISFCGNFVVISVGLIPTSDNLQMVVQGQRQQRTPDDGGARYLLLKDFFQIPAYIWAENEQVSLYGRAVMIGMNLVGKGQKQIPLFH